MTGKQRFSLCNDFFLRSYTEKYKVSYLRDNNFGANIGVFIFKISNIEKKKYDYVILLIIFYYFCAK
jgi:hypothetical protein